MKAEKPEPRKIRQLIADLERVGFVNRGGRDSHRNYIHPKGPCITVSGKSGDDARHYQEKQVRGISKMKITRSQIKTHARRYLKVVEWSEEDGVYIGSAPPIIGHCCHGKTEAEVLRQLTTIVEEWVEMFLRDGKPLPPPSAGKTYSGKFLVRVAPGVHQKAALKAQARGESLNQFVADAIAQA